MVVVLANTYTGILLSFISVNKMGPVINSLDELARSDRTQLVPAASKDISGRFL
jgi:hypothetical protein